MKQASFNKNCKDIRILNLHPREYGILHEKGKEIKIPKYPFTQFIKKWVTLSWPFLRLLRERDSISKQNA